MARGGLRLRVASASLQPGARVAVSVRPHEIALLSAPAGAGPAGANTLRGVVQRASFLGDGVDCQVQVEGSDVVLRVAAPAAPRRRAGEMVALRIEPRACVVLADGG